MNRAYQFPLATALQEVIRQGYGLPQFGKDLLAGLIVSLVALPLSMALSIAVGLPPQHGIYTAIVAGIIVALLGGSRTQVTGPTAAFVVIVAPIVAEHGLRGLILAQLMAGLILLALAWARMGKLINYVPYPVTTGFTAGIAVVLGALSLNDLLGLGIEHLDGSFIEKLGLLLSHVPDARAPEMLIGGVSLAIMLMGKRITRKIPSVIMGIGVGTFIAWVLAQNGIAVATIGSRFSYETAHGMAQGIPPYPPVLHMLGGEGLFAWPSYKELHALWMPSLVIAALAALESLLSATVADGLTRTRHHPNSELAALGIGNIFSGLAAGVPATGAIARTTTNIKSGAVSPIASIIHAVLIMLYVWFLAPWIAYVPMAALAALLVVTAYNMSHYKQCWRILTIAPRHDVAVLVTCFVLTVFIDMVAGVTVGILLSVLLFIRRIADITEGHVHGAPGDVEQTLPDNVLVYHISGPLFFATVERALDRTAFIRHKIDTLILDMEQVQLIDMSGLVALKNLLSGEVLAGKRIFLCAKPEVLEKIRQKLEGEPVNIMLVASMRDAVSQLA